MGYVREGGREMPSRDLAWDSGEKVKVKVEVRWKGSRDGRCGVVEQEHAIVMAGYEMLKGFVG